jgi:prefoldin subunit 5
MVDSAQLELYERLLKDKLLPLLKQKQEIARDSRSRAREISDALRGIEKLRTRQSHFDDQPCEILADIGCGYRVKALSTATSVAVNIGLDIFVDMPLDEATTFLKFRFKVLNENANKAEEEAEIVKRDYESAAKAYSTLRLMREHSL